MIIHIGKTHIELDASVGSAQGKTKPVIQLSLILDYCNGIGSGGRSKGTRRK